VNDSDPGRQAAADIDAYKLEQFGAQIDGVLRASGLKPQEAPETQAARDERLAAAGRGRQLAADIDARALRDLGDEVDRLIEASQPLDPKVVAFRQAYARWLTDGHPDREAGQ
jgi:hypothetical protein